MLACDEHNSSSIHCMYSMGHKKVPVPFLLKNGIRSVCPKENGTQTHTLRATVHFHGAFYGASIYAHGTFSLCT